MRSNNYLGKLDQSKTVKELIQGIKNIYKEFTHEEYLPAIIDEGTFTVENGENFYVKLVLKHQSIKLNRTWLKDNLASYLEEPGENNVLNTSAFVHNVITYRNFKTRNLYQLNPILVGEGITEYEYTSADLVNAYFNEEYSNIKGLPVLKKTSENNLLVLKNTLYNYLNSPESNVYPKFELVAEFEYRSHNNHFGENDSNVYAADDYYVKVDRVDNKTYILGSITLPIKDIKLSEIIIERKVKVIDLNSLKPRKHNASHYNGDTVEGFICFKYNVIDVLEDYYYFYDLQMFDKSNTDNSYLVDVLEDKVVFWEAEYNKLPKSIKDKIDSYNFVPKSKNNLISNAMYAMQLGADWNWNRKLEPDLALAFQIRDKFFKRAIDMDLSFLVPADVNELQMFILKIEALTGIKLEEFNSNAEDVLLLTKVRETGSVTINNKDLVMLYKKYCFAIRKRLSNARNK